MGSLAILIRNHEDFEAFNFSIFMSELEADVRSKWHAAIKPNGLLFLEKRLRGIRILVLKTENLLLRTSRRVRGIYEKGNDANNGIGTNDKENK